jgi:hypothetical protein
MSGQLPGPTANTNTTQQQSGTTQAQRTGTSVVNTELPDWYLGAWQSMLGLGGDLYGGLATPVAGLTPDQLSASYWANDALQDYMTRPQIPAYDVFGMGQQWDKGVMPVAQAAMPGTPFMGALGGAQQSSAQQASPASAQAAQLKPEEIAPFMNPYIENAIQPALDHLRTQQGEVQAGIGANAAASQMFGGSREAVQRMLADRNYRETAASTAGNMLNQGWNTASGLASQNTDRSQQTNLANAQMENTINALNAQLGTQSNMQNAQLGTQASLQNAQLGTQAGMLNSQLANQINLANASAQNQAQSQYQNLSYQGAQSDAARFLQAIGLQSQNDLQGYQGALSGINSLMGIGTQQQQTAQASLDAYWKQLNNLAALLRIGNPGGTVTGNTTENANTNTNTTTNTQGQTTTSKPIDWASILLGAGKLLG